LHDEREARDASWSTAAERAIPQMEAAIDRAFAPLHEKMVKAREAIAAINADLFA